MFNTKIQLYLICLIASILSELFFLYKTGKKLNYKNDEIIGLLVLVLTGAILGGKYFSFFSNYKSYNGVFNFTEVGFLAYGALIGSIIMCAIFSIEYEKKFKDLMYTISIAMPIMYCFGKIGCFFAGCCHGIEYHGPLSLTYYYSDVAPYGISLFPIQLLEALVFLFLFIYILKKSKKEKHKNIIIALSFFTCSIAKLLLEFLRMSHIGKILTINQILALTLTIISGIYLIYNKKKIVSK